MNIMITGASSGIGLRTAEKLVAAGHTVFNVSRTACEQPRIVNILVDLGEPDGVVRAFDTAVKRCGKLDAGIYCAGYAIAGSLADVDYADAATLTQVNYLSATRFAAEFVRRFKRGKVILTASMSGYFPLPYQPHYSASKAALIAFTRSVAQEYKYTGFQIACVTPDGVATPFSAHRQKVYGVRENQNLDAAIAAITDIEQTGQLADDVAETIVGLLDKTAMPVVVRTKWTDSLKLLGAAFLPAKAEDALIFKKFGQKKPRLVKAPVQSRPSSKPKIIDLTEDREAEITPEEALAQEEPFFPPEEIAEGDRAPIQ